MIGIFFDFTGIQDPYDLNNTFYFFSFLFQPYLNLPILEVLANMREVSILDHLCAFWRAFPNIVFFSQSHFYVKIFIYVVHKQMKKVTESQGCDQTCDRQKPIGFNGVVKA